MRNILIMASVFLTLGATAGTASAQTACGSVPCLQLAQSGGLREWSYDWDTRPRPQYYPDRYESRRYGRRDLRYYCSLGRHTPRSLRDDCRRYGYW